MGGNDTCHGTVSKRHAPAGLGHGGATAAQRSRALACATAGRLPLNHASVCNDCAPLSPHPP